MKSLREASRKVAKLLGAREIFLSDFPDNRFDTVPLLDIVKEIERVIKKVKPSVIFTHHGSDLNIDHKITHRAVMTAARPRNGTTVREIYMFEVPSSTEWALKQFEPVFCPSVFYDISKTFNAKTKAMRLYETEARTADVRISLQQSAVRVFETNMIEAEVTDLSLQGKEFRVVVEPYEVKTLKVEF